MTICMHGGNAGEHQGAGMRDRKDTEEVLEGMKTKSCAGK